MIDIDSYKTLFTNKKIKIIYIWLLITIFIILSVTLFIKNIAYEEIYQNKGLVTKDGYLKALIEVNDIEKITSINKIIIDNEKYAYKIVKFNQEINQIGNGFYQEVFIDIDADILENRYISFKIPIKKYSFFDFIKNKIGGNI